MWSAVLSAVIMEESWWYFLGGFFFFFWFFFPPRPPPPPLSTPTTSIPLWGKWECCWGEGMETDAVSHDVFFFCAVCTVGVIKETSTASFQGSLHFAESMVRTCRECVCVCVWSLCTNKCCYCGNCKFIRIIIDILLLYVDTQTQCVPLCVTHELTFNDDVVLPLFDVK